MTRLPLLLSTFLIGVNFLHANGVSDDLKPFRLDGPEVLKIDWNTRSLHSGDYNGDGLNDVSFVNRERSRIQIHYRRKPGEMPPGVKPSRTNRWEPLLDDAPYVRENIPTSIDVTALTFADFDGDKQLDLAYSSREEGVYIHFREKDSFSRESLEIETGELRSYRTSILGKDLDDDGQAELLIHAKDGLQVLRFKNRSPLPNPELYKDNSEGSMGLYFADINGDGKEDWVYQSFGSKYGVRSRLRTENGFGPELSHRFQPSGEVLPLGRGLGDCDQPVFLTVEAESRQVAVFQISTKSESPKNEVSLIPLVENVFASDNNTTSFEFADFTGDGLMDIAAATSSNPSIQLYKGKKDGNYESVGSFPSLGDITQLVSGNFKSSKNSKRSTLILLSAKEKLVGLTRFDNRFHFPKAISMEDEPVMVQTCDLDGDKFEDLLVVTKERYDFTLRRFTQDEQGNFQQTLDLDLDGFKRPPSGLFPCDLNGDGNEDLLVLSSRDPALYLQGDGQGGLKEAAKDSAVRKSLLVGLTPNRISMADINGDNKEELLVAGTGYVRAVTLKGKELEVLDQFNAQSSKDEVLSPFTLDVTGDKTPEILYYVPEGRIDILAQAKDGVYRFLKSHDLAPFPLQALKILPPHSGRSAEILAFGKHTFRRIPIQPSNDLPTLKVLHRFDSDLRGIQLRGVDTGDFNSDGRPDVLGVDFSKNLLEFFRLSKDGKEWHSVLHFHIFEKNLHVRGERGAQPEPREGLVTDLNGDGKDDLVLLVHDRLLHYYQR